LEHYSTHDNWCQTGQPRTLPLIALFEGETIALVASSFGRKQNPAWYFNLKAHPECQVQWNGRTGIYLARETSSAEYEKYWQLAVFSYAGYEKYKEWAGRKIPVMVLESKS
jgi:F420H(2)-dependent quinone reductase